MDCDISTDVVFHENALNVTIALTKSCPQLLQKFKEGHDVSASYQ